MDVALGLPALSGNMALANTPSGNFGALASLPPPLPSYNYLLGGVSQGFMQQLMPFNGSGKSSANSPYALGASIHSPLTATSPNSLLGHSDAASSMTHFPTSAFASLNLVNALDLQHSAQISHHLQATTASADISALLASSVLPQMAAGISADPGAAASLARVMQPVPSAMSAASSTVDSVASLFPARIALGNLASQQQVQSPCHNSHPMLLHGYQAPFLASPPLGTPPLSASQVTPSSGDGNVITNGMEREFKNRLGLFAMSSAASASDGLVAISAPAAAAEQQLPPLSIPMAPGGGTRPDYAFTSPPFVTSPLARSSIDATTAGTLPSQQQNQP
ncbi:hypothetical protein GGF44_001399, partial [Coemansia sp. RSA 1694]